MVLPLPGEYLLMVEKGYTPVPGSCSGAVIPGDNFEFIQKVSGFSA